MTDLPNATIARIAKKNGVVRLSSDATAKLVEVAEKYISDVAKKSSALAGHAGRKTVQADDIALAVTAGA